MNDEYPEFLEIEIDRNQLRRYLRMKWFLSWVMPFSLFGFLFGMPALGKQLDRGVTSLSELINYTLTFMAIGFGFGLLISLASYLIFSHWLARRFADNLHVSVEGSFLRIRQHVHSVTDRKLHFRSIVDYATSQSTVMRWFGIQQLQMSTTAGGMASTITVPGVKDCLKVRDMLSDVDRLRENQ